MVRYESLVVVVALVRLHVQSVRIITCYSCSSSGSGPCSEAHFDPAHHSVERIAKCSYCLKTKTEDVTGRIMYHRTCGTVYYCSEVNNVDGVTSFCCDSDLCNAGSGRPEVADTSFSGHACYVCDSMVSTGCDGRVIAGNRGVSVYTRCNYCRTSKSDLLGLDYYERSCESMCTPYDDISSVTECCQSDYCNDGMGGNSFISVSCYVCSSSSEPACLHANLTSTDVTSQLGCAACKTTTVTVGFGQISAVHRSCVASCTASNSVAGMSTSCCYTDYCNSAPKRMPYAPLMFATTFVAYIIIKEDLNANDN